MDNQFAITGPDNGDGTSKKQEESKKRREKKRMSQILYSDNRRQRLNERLRAKLENRKNQEEQSEVKKENNVLSEEDLVTLFDSEDKPKKRKRKKRKNRKKKKKAEKKDVILEENIEQTSSTQPEAVALSNAGELSATANEVGVGADAGTGAGAGGEASLSNVDAALFSRESLKSVISSDSSGAVEAILGGKLDEEEVSLMNSNPSITPSMEKEELARSALRSSLEDNEICHDSKNLDDNGSTAGESTKEGEHLSCGESSTSSRERSTSHEHDEIKEAGETVSNDGEGEEARNLALLRGEDDLEPCEEGEEERSTISPEERGNLTEMILDDEFPWHLYHAEEDTCKSPSAYSLDGNAGFTVVRRKEKRIRKRKVSPPRKKKRRGDRRHNRKTKEKKKEKQSPTKKRSTPMKNSPRSACPIRPVIPITPKNERKPERPHQSHKGDPTLSSPSSPPPGFSPTKVNHIKCHAGIPKLTKPFEQMQAVNAMFMRMPAETIITIPFTPMDNIADGPDMLPMNLDLSYPAVLDCTIPYFVFPAETPIDTVSSPQYS